MDVAAVHKPVPVVPTPAEPADTQQAARNRELIQAIKAINGAELFGSKSELTFALDRLTQRPVIRLIDKETKDVIRQIPPEYVLRMAEDLAPRR